MAKLDKIVNLHANTKEIVILHTCYGQIAQKALLNTQIQRKFKFYTHFMAKSAKFVTLNVDTRTVGYCSSSLTEIYR